MVVSSGVFIIRRETITECPENEEVWLTPAIEKIELICQPPATGNPTPADPNCFKQGGSTIQVAATERTEYRCSPPYTNSPDDETVCVKPSIGIERVDATATTTYRCPAGTNGNPSDANPFCNRPVQTQKQVDPIVTEVPRRSNRVTFGQQPDAHMDFERTG